jgi:hypothetical protein
MVVVGVTVLKLSVMRLLMSRKRIAIGSASVSRYKRTYPRTSVSHSAR